MKWKRAVYGVSNRAYSMPYAFLVFGLQALDFGFLDLGGEMLI